MIEKRGLASKSKNSFNNSKIFILAILSILMFAASVSYAVAVNDASGAIELTVSPPNVIANGTGTFGTGDTFYFSDKRTMNETIWVVFNVTFPDVAVFNATTANITVNCSGVGDTKTILRNATVAQQPAGGAHANNYMVKYRANCSAIFNETSRFYTAAINITINNQSREIVNSTLATGIMIYNMTTPSLLSTGQTSCMQWGPETTNFSTINDFRNVNVILQMLGNISCFTCTDGPGVCTAVGSQILPATGCPDGICGWQRNFTAVTKLNFTSLNLSNSTFYSILMQLPSAMTINVPASNSRYGAATTKIWFNSSFFLGLNTNATVELYRIPFKGKPDIVTDTGLVNSTQVELVAAEDGNTYNITFAVFRFSTYNASDVTAPIIASQYPANATAYASFNPRLNFTLNGTASEVNISTLTVLFFGTEISNVSLTYLNFTCTNETSDGTIGSYMACLLNQSMTGANITTSNGTYSAKVVVEDMGGDAGIKQNYTLTFVSTTMPPTISFASPASLSWKNNTAFLNFTLSFNSSAAITGNGINISKINITVFAPSAGALRFYVNGTNESIKLTALANGAYDVFVNFTEAQTLPNASVIVKVTAQDNLLNVLPWTNLTFYSDEKKPFVGMNSSPQLNTSSVTPSLNVTVSDTVSLNFTCNLLINGKVNTTQVFTNGSGSYLISPTTLTDGLYEWGVNCTDVAGNTNNTLASRMRNLTVDTSAPTVNHTTNPLNNTHVAATKGIFRINITDSPRTIENITNIFTTTNTKARCTWDGAGATYAVSDLNIANGTQFYEVFGNCSVLETKYAWTDNDNLTVTLRANDTVANELVYVLKWSIDTKAPAITSPKISKTNLNQGENITFYVTIIDAVSGINTTNATVFIDGLYGACTNISNFTRTLALVSGSNYSFQYNTSALAQGNYSLKGSVFATDFVLDGTNLNTTILGKTTSLNFTVTASAGASNPTIERVEINQTTFVLNQTSILLNITVNVTDSDNISQVWVKFSGNSAIPNSSLKIPLREITTSGGVGGTYRNESYNFNVTGANTTSITMTVYANDTLGNNASKSMTLTVRQTAAVVDSLSVTPATPYQYQPNLNISAIFFAYYGTTIFEVNITNSSSRTAANPILNLSNCAVINVSSFLYNCWNYTNNTAIDSGELRLTNETGVHTITTWRVLSGAILGANATYATTTVNYTIYAAGNRTVGTIPADTTLNFVESGLSVANSGDNVTLPTTPTTLIVNMTAGVYGFTVSMSNVNMSLGIGNLTVNLRNFSVLNSINHTNTTNIANSTNLGNYIKNATAVYAVIAFEPTATNLTLLSNALTTTNNLTIYCSELGINCTNMAVYKSAFNFTTNKTVDSTWSVLVPTYNVLNNSLTVNVSSFSVFAVAEPVACTNNGVTGTTAVPSTGCVYGGIIYTSGYVCSGAWQSTVCYTAPAATTTTTTTSTSSSDAPVGNVTPTTKSTYLLGTISSGIERTVSISLAGVPVTSIAITTNKEALNTELQIQQLSAAPTDAGNVPSKVYAYMSVTPKNLAPEIITTAKMSFSVTKSWMTQNGITEDQIVLSRYADGKWNDLETTLLSSDDTKVNYQAITPGFSYFAVTIREAPLVAPEEQKEVPTKPAEQKETPTEQPPAEEEQPPVQESKSWIAWLIVALVAVAGVAGYFIYRNMSKK